MSNRLEELKTKGWANLDKEERKEYQSLIAASDAGEYVKPEENKGEDDGVDEKVDMVADQGTKKNSKERTVTVTETQLRRMINEEVAKFKETAQEGMEEVLRVGRWMKSIKPKKQNVTATMRLYRVDGFADPGLVIDWKFLKNIEDPDTKKINVPVYRITVLYDEGKKQFDIPLQQLVEISEYEKVEVIKQTIEEQEKRTPGGQRAFTEKGYNFSSPGFFGTKSKGPGEAFDYVEKRKDGTVTIKRQNGQELELPVDRLNQ